MFLSGRAMTCLYRHPAADPESYACHAPRFRLRRSERVSYAPVRALWHSEVVALDLAETPVVVNSRVTIALDHWDKGTPSELRRVLYVGASRAQQLLILAVHTVHRDRVATLLKRDGVPYDLV
jgi:hypothetical protein